MRCTLSSRQVKTRAAERLTLLLGKTAEAVEVDPYVVVFDDDARGQPRAANTINAGDEETVELGRRVPTRHVLADGASVTVGRGSDADLALGSTSVSRRHARLTRSGDEVRVVDLGSRNGVTVNGEPLAGERPLRSGDVVGIGNVILVYHARRHPGEAGKLWEEAAFRARLAALRAQRRPLAVISVRFAAPPADVQLIERVLPDFGLATWLRPDHLIIAWSEVGRTELDAAIAHFSDELSDVEIGSALSAGSEPPGWDIIAAAAEQKQTTVPPPMRRIELPAGTIVVADPAMERIYRLIERLSVTDLPILILGPTGAGKELAAAAVHHWSARRDRPFVAINCATLPESLAESELFGHEKGAFSGATAAKPGLLESARGGTVFLDELGELSPAVQTKLLRVLEVKKARRLGELGERDIDIRIVGATHHDLEAEARSGRFREDLYYRLSGASVWLPPLTARPHEMLLLAEHMLVVACQRQGRPALRIAEATRAVFLAHPWPGNIRELKNTIEYAVATAGGAEIEPGDLPPRMVEQATVAPAPPPAEPGEPAAPATTPRSFRPIEEELRELEKARILAALEECGGNQTRAAELIQMPRRTLIDKMKLYGMKRVP